MTDFFRLSWSLAVEEWFYYLFPLIMLGCIGFRASSRKAAGIAIVIFIAVPFLSRIYLPPSMSHLGDIDQGIRQIVIFRLDAIGFGVLTAYLYYWHRHIFEKVAKLWFVSLFVVTACVLCAKFSYPVVGSSRVLFSVYLTIASLAFAGLIPFLYNLGSSRFSWFNRSVKYTSLISYSLYLGHIFAFIIVIVVLRKSQLFDAVYPVPWIVYPLFLISAYLLASLTYYLVEKPILRLRDRKNGVFSGAIRPTDAQPDIFSK